MGARSLSSLALLLVILVSVALGLADVIRGLDAPLMLAVAVIGSMIGWGLAALPLSGWTSPILAAVLGWGMIFLRVGRLGGKLVALLPPLVGLAWDIFSWHTGPSPDWMPAIVALVEWWGEFGALLGRVRDWALALAAGEPAFDPVAATLVWSLALWLVSAWAGWMMRRRRRPLQSVTPAGALLAATLSYAGGESHVLLVSLGAILLLLVLVGYDRRIHRWQATGVDFADLGLDTAVAAAALAPSLSVREVIEFVRDLARTGKAETVAESLGMDQRRGQGQWTILDEMRATGLPRRRLLGSGPELSERVVMIISTGDLPSGPPERLTSQSPPRYYWRSLTYDRYVLSGWYAGATETIEYGAGEPAITPTLTTRRTVRQEIQVLGDAGGLLHAAGALVAADQDYSVAWRSPGDAFGATIEATTYRADSLLPVVSEEQLRSAGSDYPAWVRDRYLALPDTTSDRVLSLARDLTATAPTPYDRARAIETYLRTFSYTLDVPEPPSGRDVVDYFLFDLQKGYCDYYATAMVVLARAAGLPARLAVGYASGSYDSYQAHYVVAEADAHAWAEVYFPGYEWVEFEPTGGLPSIERPAESVSLEWPEPEGTLEPAAAEWYGLDWQPWLPVGLALPVLAGIIWMAADGWRLRRMEPLAAVTTLYRRLQQYGPPLAVPRRAADTPYEFAASLAERVKGLARRGRWKKLLAPAVRELRRLTDIYVQGSYSPRLPDAADQSRAIQTWQKLRWRLWLARLWQSVKHEA